MGDAVRIDSWEYVAGFFDGEGGLYIAKQIRKDGRVIHRLTCSITNTNKKVMEELSKFICHPMYTCDYKPPMKTRYDIRLHGRKAVTFLLEVQPFVVAKEEQIYLALEFADRFSRSRRRLSKDEIEIRDKTMLKLKLLNGRKGGWPSALKQG